MTDMTIAWATLAAVLIGVLVLWLLVRRRRKKISDRETREWDSQDEDDKIIERLKREGKL